MSLYSVSNANVVSPSSSSSSAVPITPGVDSRAREVACQKIREIIDAEVLYLRNEGLEPSTTAYSISKEQLENLVVNLVQFIREHDKLKPDQEVTEARMEGLLSEDMAHWIEVEERGALRLSGWLLGSGGECSVSPGVTSNGRICAIKAMHKETDPSREAKFLRILSSADFVNRWASSDWYRIDEFCSRSDLEKISQNDPAYLIASLPRIVETVLRGLAHMHSYNIVHGDIKKLNIFMTGSGEVKIADLGFSHFMEEPTLSGTHVLFAPEQIEYFFDIVEGDGHEHPLNSPEKVDIWQAMLLFADIAKIKLSKPFRKRINDYLNIQEAFSLEAEAKAKAAGSEKAIDIEAYMNRARTLFWAIAADRAAHQKDGRGLFSDIEAAATTDFERSILVPASAFNYRTRSSARQLLWNFKGCVV